MTSKCMTLLGAAAAVAVLVAACTGGDGVDDGDADAWCAQFDVAISATVQVREAASDGDGLDEAFTVVDDEMRALRDLDTPAAIADDWEAVSGPPTTDASGGLDPDGVQEAAGQRVAAWALENCELSNAVRAEMAPDD